MCAGTVVGTFETLVRIPGRVSKFITRYTGVTDEMLVDAPPIERVLDDFREFQSGAVLVAHNLPTDLGYLNREAVWGQRPLFPGDGLDTMELMQVLMPEAEVSGLADALELLGEQESPRHRALPDARATHRLFAALVDRARARGVTTVEALRALGAEGGPEGPMPQRAKELARWASRNLPPSPGAYVFRDASGRALYVGKTVSLQRRVRAHFTTSHSFVRQRADMLPRIDHIDWEVTGSELRALLREAELIGELAPVYNVQRQRRASRLLVHVGPAEAAVVNTASTMRGESGDYVGPFPTARDARLAAQAARRLLDLPARGACAVEPWRRAAALAYLRSGREAAIAVVTDADAPAEERESIVRRVRRSRAERLPLAGGLGGDRVVVVDSGRQPGDAEIALIADSHIARHVVLSRPRRGGGSPRAAGPSEAWTVQRVRVGRPSQHRHRVAARPRRAGRVPDGAAGRTRSRTRRAGVGARAARGARLGAPTGERVAVGPDQDLNWRRRSESNRGIGVLQTPALPLGYVALAARTARQNT